MLRLAQSERLERLNAGITAPKGFTAAGVEAGLKKQGPDLAVIYSQTEAAAAGMFTTNRVKAAPVLLSRENLASGRAQAVVANSGNANACNADSENGARVMAVTAARLMGIQPERVVVASTGVIGMPLPIERVKAGIETAVRCLSPTREAASAAAAAIMTTDTRPKEAAVRFRIGSKPVTVAGMAKGSGMIHPGLATMLVFLTSDAAIGPELLRKVFSGVITRTFNQITIDGDCSTNDTAVILANGMAGNQPLQTGEDLDRFTDALEAVCVSLARDLASDGEGASRLISVLVRGARNEQEARTAARAVAGSNLVKAAVYGCDANWGRIICALGYSGAGFDPSRVCIYLAGGGEEEQVARGGNALPFDEERACRILKQPEVNIIADLGAGSAEGRAWGCDLTYDYVRINASYRS